MKNFDGHDFENAVQFLSLEFSKTGMQKKPAFFHSLRVGSLLFHYGFSEEICIAGLMHDSIEDTAVNYKILEDMYGENVAKIVLCNTKNNKLSKEEFKIFMVRNCNEYSQEALAVKIADVYDNFIYYKRQNNISEIERCKVFAGLIKEYKKEKYNHQIFNLIEEILEY